MATTNRDGFTARISLSDLPSPNPPKDKIVCSATESLPLQNRVMPTPLIPLSFMPHRDIIPTSPRAGLRRGVRGVRCRGDLRSWIGLGPENQVSFGIWTPLIPLSSSSHRPCQQHDYANSISNIGDLNCAGYSSSSTVNLFA